MDLLERLAENGVDTLHSLERFGGNEALYARFLMKFPSDPNFSQLTEAVDNQDYDAALSYAHTLKGLSANLGMDRLSESCAELVGRLRSGETQELTGLMAQLLSNYENIIAALQAS